jgi:outer membrane protein OmpA-like peptidoglycan-associated protein
MHAFIEARQHKTWLLFLININVLILLWLKPQSMKGSLLTLFVFFFTVTSLIAQTPTRYELVSMGKKVNTFHHEGAPIVSPDGNTLYFFVQNHPENTYGKDESQDIWMTKKDANGEWETPTHLTSPFNESRSNQVCTVFPDGSLCIKGGRSKNEKGFSLVTGRSLQELDIDDFNKMNKGRFYGGSMSGDKKHIIIYMSEVQNSPNSDLYESHLLPNGSWSRPAKLKLSTTLDDVGPFIGPDQKTLYFGSARQGKGRQGGVDIYKAIRLDDTWANWSEPVNLGKPINTGGDDFYFTMDQNGNVYTSRANKAIEGAQLDLYMLVPKVFKIDLVGTVFNKKTQQPMPASVEVKMKDKDVLKLTASDAGKFETKIDETREVIVSASAPDFLLNTETFPIPVVNSDTTINVEIDLTPIAKKLILSGDVLDKKTGKPVTAKVSGQLKSDKKTNFKVDAAGGKYEQEIPKLGWYILAVSATGYVNTTDSVWINSDEVSPVTKDLYLQPIEVGLTVRLKNIYFDFDKTTLKSQSFLELNKVVDFLKQNQTVEIEISGHTDSKGSDDYNLNLSQGRSQAVVDYLITQGIDSYRLTAHGYGETKPVDTNDTEEGRANNRRVEFTIVKK